jgi:SAM-dependent methyltransferase
MGRADPATSRKGTLKGTVKALLPASVVRVLKGRAERLKLKAHSAVSDPMQFERPTPARECPICGYTGRFWSFGSPPRAEALCPDCLGLERHRLLKLMFDRFEGEIAPDSRVLHFAPEPFVRGALGPVGRYVTIDISGWGVDCAGAMEALPFSDASFDIVIANHVLEHVASEIGALTELKRVVGPTGVLILSVPQIQGWAATYENDSVTAAKDRRIHFGQEDHLRLYGRDFVDRLRRAGLAVEAFQMDPGSEVRYGLNRGETIFLARPVRG